MKMKRDLFLAPGVASILGETRLRIYPVGASLKLFNPWKEERHA
jgi:hypothetical protein